MDPKKAQQDLKEGKIWPIYYLYGEEPFKIQLFIDRMKQIHLGEIETSSDGQFEKYDGSEHKSDEILSALNTMGLFAGIGEEQKKVVLVRNAGQLKNSEILFTEVMEANNPYNSWGNHVLIFVSDTFDQRRKVNQWIKKKGFALEFKKSKSDEIFGWIDYLSKKLKIKIDQDAAQSLALSSDGSLFQLAHEIEKAFLHSGAENGTTISLDSVTKVSTQKITHEMFELVETIFSRKKARSLLLIEKIILHHEDALGLVGFLTWALKSPQSRNWNLKQKKTMIEKLVSLDHKLKSSSLEFKTLVENFILEII